MDLAQDLLRQLDNPGLTLDKRAGLRCALAKQLEEAGNYEAARAAMSELWQRIGERPLMEGLSDLAAAEVLLRAGVLTGWLGSAHQVERSQEIAKDFISESASIFERRNEAEKLAEARIELAYCYWREGAFDEARAILRGVLSHLESENSDLTALAHLRMAIVEATAGQLRLALQILADAMPLFEKSDNHSLRGKFHNERAIDLRNLGAVEKREDYVDLALLEYEAASYHFEQAGHLRYRGRVENNLGFLFFKSGRFPEAHEHLDRARRLFESLKDKGSMAQVDESRARAFLAEGRNVEAEGVARRAVRVLGEGGEQALLAEALTTLGVALARLKRYAEAHKIFERAGEVAYQAGDSEGAGAAALALLEEMSEQMGREERLEIYGRADQLLSQSQHPEILARLRAAARLALSATAEAQSAPRPDRHSWPNFVYASDRMAELLKRAHRIATTTHPLLITGETGTGKELMARLVHEWSGRAGEFVAADCGALAEKLIESELFGHRRGSFTEALTDNPGLVRQAKGGTLLLDDVAELSLGAQSQLLRLIEHGEIQTIGEPVPERADVRVIAASRHDLKRCVEEGSFREDLFYRLQPFHVEIPPLRERPEDIEALAKHFIKETLAQGSKRVTFTPEAMEAMRALSLEGNARQLRAVIERTLVAASEGAVITAEAVEVAGLRPTQRTSFVNPWEGFSLKEEVRRFEAHFIELALKEADGHVSRAARLLGFKHHESLSSLLETKHRELLEIRVPASPRRRSIIRHHKPRRT